MKMKKFKLFLFLLTGFMTSCMNDDMCEDFGSQEYEHYLLQKSEEFAKKYNVEVHLDEDRIKEIAKSLTVEQMEEDYKSISQQTVFYNKEINKPTKGKLGIRKRIQAAELPIYNRGEINGSCACGSLGTIELNLTWNEWAQVYHGHYQINNNEGLVPWIAFVDVNPVTHNVSSIDATANIQFRQGYYRYQVIVSVIYRTDIDTIWRASILSCKELDNLNISK